MACGCIWRAFICQHLCFFSVPTEIQPVTSGDSITLNLPSWISVPSLSYITLYKNVVKSSSYIQPFNGYLPTFQKCLPYWCVLQALGHDGVLEQIRYGSDLSKHVENMLAKHRPYINVLSFKQVQNGNGNKTTYSIGDLFAKALSFLTYVETNNPVIIFKCDQKHIREKFFFGVVNPVKKPEAKKDFFNINSDYVPIFDYEKKMLEKVQEPEIEPRDEIDEYTDTLTTWLADLMNSLHKKFDLELIEIEKIGVCIRFSPLDHANVVTTFQQDLDAFSQSLYDVMSILDASIKCKSLFEESIKDYKNLCSVNVPKWAGIGAVRYIPDYLKEKMPELLKYQEEKILELSSEEESNKETDDAQSVSTTSAEVPTTNGHDTNKIKKEFIKNDLYEKYLEEIKIINNSLAEKLQTNDGAFSLGEASDRMLAVKFGMVNEIDDLKKLATQVQEVGKEVEESTKFIEKATELILQGIEKANKDLRRENELKLMQQGVFRQIPIVAGLYNWLLPTEPVTTTGRSFNLQSGKVASTESTLKYHMQINTDENPPNDNSDTVSNKSLPLANHLENSTTRSTRKISSSSVHSTTSVPAINGDEAHKQ